MSRSIPDRPGQLLRQALQERFEGDGGGAARRYDLTVALLDLGRRRSRSQQDTTVTRIRLIGYATWTLIADDLAHTPITSGTARAMDCVNILDSQFSPPTWRTKRSRSGIAEAAGRPDHAAARGVLPQARRHRATG